MTRFQSLIALRYFLLGYSTSFSKDYTLKVSPRSIDDEVQEMHHELKVLVDGAETDYTVDLADGGYVMVNRWLEDEQAMLHLYDGTSPAKAIEALTKALSA